MGKDNASTSPSTINKHARIHLPTLPEAFHGAAVHFGGAGVLSALPASCGLGQQVAIDSSRQVAAAGCEKTHASFVRLVVRGNDRRRCLCHARPRHGQLLLFLPRHNGRSAAREYGSSRRGKEKGATQEKRRTADESRRSVEIGNQE